MDRWPDWGKHYQHGLFIIQPPEDIKAIVDAQRETYDPLSCSYVGAHITVTQPLLDKPSEQDWELFLQALENTQSFLINYGPIKSFLPYPCIWYDVQPAERVLKIRRTLHQTGLFDLEGGYIEDFIPHMTVTEEQSGPKVTLELLDQIQGESQPGSFLCQELIFSAPDQNFHFSPINRISLK